MNHPMSDIIHSNRSSDGDVGAGRGFHGFIGESPPMMDLYRTLSRVGPSTASVLVVGESGTGKELAARTIHDLSDRSGRSLVALNCAAIPEGLIESELFGHEEGAFTGANRMRRGCFELAHGGTLFLDELGAMPVASQVKLLRALEERSFRRLRGAKEIRVDVRILAAMSEDPRAAVSEGRLREDLLYRINVFTITLPTLRERPSDLFLLAEHFIEHFARENGKEAPRLGAEAKSRLAHHDWPGNVRELRNAMERAVILAKGRVIGSEQLLPSTSTATASAKDDSMRAAGGGAAGDPEDCRVRVGMTLAEAERALLLRTLVATGYNKTQTARMLGVSAKTVYNKLKEWSGRGDPEAVEAERRSSRRPRDAPRRQEADADGRLVSIADARARRRVG